MAGDDSSKGTEPGQRQPDHANLPQAPLALYRRYRPASFAEVKGQEHVTEPLRQALRSGRVHHAYLFSGPRGCGKTSSARILARSLNCEQGPTPDPCGVCASCVALGPAGPGSIDVIEIDAASHGGIDDARDLRERAFYSPVSARYKIYIIDEAHMVTGAGFNALLKLVEEPPPHLKFVFATTEPEKVIATIRSRTHHYPFRLVPPAILRELLEEILAAEQVTYEPAVLPVVIRAGAGSVRDALSVLDQLIAGADDAGLRYDRAIALLGYTDDALLDEMAMALGGGDGAAVFQAIDHVVEAGHDPRRFAMDLLDRLRDLIVLSAVPDAAKSGLIDASEDQIDRMREQAAGFGQERLARAAETISAGLVEMRGATSPRLLLELMCAQVLLPAGQHAGAHGAAGPAGGPSELGDLAARIDRLERRIPAGAAPGMAAGQDRRPAAAERREGAAAPPRPDTSPAPAEAGGRRAVSDTPAGSAHAEATAGGGRDGGGQGQGSLDTGTLTSRWADVLDAVREIRKTAWILLSNYATVDGVDGNVLTMSFDTEGNAKGFASSGSDSYLADVLQEMFGVRLVIRAVVRSAAGRGGTRSGQDDQRGGARPRSAAAGGETSGGSGGDAGRPGRDPGTGGSGYGEGGQGASGGRAGSGGGVSTGEGGGRGGQDQRGRASSGDGAAGDPADGEPGPRGTVSRGGSSGRTGPAGAASRGPSPARAGSGGPASGGQGSGGQVSGRQAAGGQGSGGQSSGGPASGGRASGRPASGGPAAGAAAASQDAGAPASGRPRAGRQASSGGPSRAGSRGSGEHVAGSDDPRPFTDATPAGAADLTGTDLIVRELGGRLIEETSEA